MRRGRAKMRKSTVFFIFGLSVLIASNAARWILVKVGFQIIASAFLLGAGQELQREEHDLRQAGKHDV